MTATLPSVSRERVTQLLDAMMDIKVAVVGDVMLDRYLMGDVERVSPEAPVPIVSVAEERSSPGGAANVAANVAAFGGIPLLVGAIGDDDAGLALKQSLDDLGIAATQLVTVSGRPTTSKVRLVARGQQLVRIDREVTNPLADRARESIRMAALAAIEEAEVLLIEDYDKGVLDERLAGELVGAARLRGIPVIVDPKERHFFAYQGATVFKPNRRELDRAMGAHFAGDDADLSKVRERLGSNHLLLTLGAEGMALVSEDGVVRRTASIAREVFDVSGAGDTVTAWTGTALAAGATISEAVWLANLAAGVEVSKLGTATVSTGELMAIWDDLQPV
jgi:D-beta-D-heptose 7-phosphate kinase/D-beta-D-heptose 1-phosphate adenosyltransferase